MLNRLFRRMVPKKRTKERKRVSCDELSRVLSFEGKQFEGKQEETVTKHGGGSALGGGVQWRLESGIDADTIECCVKNLEIEITDNSRYKADDEPDEVNIRYGLSSKSASLRFENCCFLLSNIGETGIKFVPNFMPEFENPHGKSFSFFGNTARGSFPFSFLFPGDSQVVFEQNDFTDIVVKGDGRDERGLSFEFIRNEFGYLHLNAPRPNDEPFKFPNEQPILYSIDCRFIGRNKIRRLELSNVADRNGLNMELDVTWYRYTTVFFGPNEKIEWEDSDNPYPARDLFRKLKHIAHERSDTGQEVILSNHISRIEYQIMRRKRRGKWYKSCEWYSNWPGRLLMWWRKWSSDFYMSWIRPFGCLIGGYLVFNAIPFLGIDSGFGDKVYGWLEFSFYSPVKIPFYAEGLKAVVDAKELKLGEGWLHFIGFLRLLWIALWGYAFRNAIRTFSSR